MSRLALTKNIKTKVALYDEAVILLGHDGAVLTSSFSPDGSCIVSGGMDRTIRLWHLPTDAQESTPNFGVFDKHKSAVVSVEWKDPETLFSVSADSTVAFWDTFTGERISRGVGHELTVNDCSISSTTCLSVGDDGSLKVWDDRVKSAVKSIHTDYPLLCCDLSSDGQVAYVAGVDPAVKAYDLLKEELMWSAPVGREIITGICLNSDGSKLAARLTDGKVVTVNSAHSVPTSVLRLGPSYESIPANSLQNLVRVCFSRDDIYLAAGSDGCEAFIWDTASRRMHAKFEGHRSSAVLVDFHPTEDIFLSCSTDGNIIIRQF